MGEAIRLPADAQVDPAAARDRLHASLLALRSMVDAGYFDTEADTCGFEVELDLVDPMGRPRLVNEPVLAALQRQDVQAELSRFNLELNLEPRPIGGTLLRGVDEVLRGTIAAVDAVTRQWGAGAIAIGTLPTLHAGDLTEEHLSANPRYALLDAVMAQVRGRPIALDISGAERLQVETHSIGVQAAATSLQIHVRVSPADFARYFNAAQAVAPAQLATGANSPYLLGRHLWQETRIALIEQSLDIRPAGATAATHPPRVWAGDGWAGSALDVLEDNVRRYPPLVPMLDDEDPMEVLAGGRVPRLHELRLHNGTIWRWNRPVYDVQHDHPHLRIENRVLPSGPTAIDMTANAAFFLGCVRSVADLDPPVSQTLPFRDMARDLQGAARLGLDADLHSPVPRTSSPVRARRLLLDVLLPLAADGLASWGVSSADADYYLGIVEERLRTRRTGAAWQVGTVAALETRGEVREAAVREMVRRYLANQRTGQPVHTWPV
jgi:gamma-glutamyl:cysteine ligase YbdK (ATP-grasp superfamily)